MLQAEDVSFAYDGQEVLQGVTLAVEPGTRTVLVGVNGSGKSTLAQLLVGDLVPSSGAVSADGVAFAKASRAEIATLVGYVGQDPLAQIVSSDVWDEVAFGPRNLGLTEAEVARRVDEALERCGLADLRDRDVHALSGGEQQRLALAGALAMGCRYLVLDEVTSHLDATSQVQLRHVVDDLVRSGVGVLEISHRASDLVGADAVLALQDGYLSPVDPTAAHGELCFCVPPTPEADPECKMRGVLGIETAPSSSIGLQNRRSQDVATWENSKSMPNTPLILQTDTPPMRGRRDLELRSVSAGYDGLSVLEDMSLVFPAGSVTLVEGPSGAGKTTLAQVAAGTLAPQAGEVLLGGERVHPGMVGLSFQRPEDQLFCNTVYDEIAYAPRNAGLVEGEVDSCVHQALAAVGLSESMLEASPFELSGGEKRRVTLGSVISGAPAAYVFDEPTAGLDAAGVAVVQDIVRDLAGAGAAVAVVSHEPGQWEAIADQTLHIERNPTPAQEPTRRTTWLHRASATAKMVALLAATIALFLVDPMGLAVAAVVLLALMESAGVRPGQFAGAVKPMAVVLLVSLLANSLVVDGSYDLQLLGMMGISSAGVVRGVAAVARVVETVGCVLLVAATTRPPELARAIAHLLRPLAHLGMSVANVSVTLMLVLRLIPESLVAFRRIECAQRARGARFGEGSVSTRLRRYLAVLVPLIVELFSRGDDLAHAMRARAYTGE